MEIQKVLFEDIDTAVSICVEALGNSPHVRYYFSGNLNLFKYYYRQKIKFGILFGETYKIIQDGKIIALSIMLHSDTEYTLCRVLRSGYIGMLFKADITFYKKMFYVAKITLADKDNFIPKKCAEISLLAVYPEFQSKGFGTGLMNFMLDKIDQGKECCYLTTTEEKNVLFYNKFGFTTVKRSRIEKGDFDMVTMLRDIQK